ncbi:MAG: hypothetical protein ACRD3W_09425 [Terriglobales bacterium]
MRYAHSGELFDPTKDWIGAVIQPSRSLIPERYSDWSVSGLTADVREGAANRFVFELVTP